MPLYSSISRPVIAGCEPGTTKRVAPIAGARVPVALPRPGLAKVRVKRQAAVHEDGLSCDVERVVAREEARHAGHLVGRSGTAHRDVALHLLFSLRVADPR